MAWKPTRRQFLKVSVAGGALCLAGGAGCAMPQAAPTRAALVSPGCRKSKVRVAKIYMGPSKSHWPSPAIDLKDEMRKYEDHLARMKADLADVDFVVNEWVSSPAQVT